MIIEVVSGSQCDLILDQDYNFENIMHKTSPVIYEDERK